MRGIAGRTTSVNIRRMVRADEMIVTTMVPDAVGTSVGCHRRTLDDAAQVTSEHAISRCAVSR